MADGVLDAWLAATSQETPDMADLILEPEYESYEALAPSDHIDANSDEEAIARESFFALDPKPAPAVRRLVSDAGSEDPIPAAQPSQTCYPALCFTPTPCRSISPTVHEDFRSPQPADDWLEFFQLLGDPGVSASQEAELNGLFTPGEPGVSAVPVFKKRRIMEKRPPRHDSEAQVVEMSAEDALLHAKTVEVVNEYHALARAFQKRNFWTVRWIKANQHTYTKEASYRQKYEDARKAFHGMSEAERERMLGEWACAGVSAVGDRGPGEGNQNAKHAPSTTVRATAALITWNVAPCDEPTFVALWSRLKHCDPETPGYDKLIEDVQALDVVQRAWEEFTTFAKKLQKWSCAHEVSGSMELSLKAETARWHFHLTLSNIREARTDRCEAAIQFEKPWLEAFAPSPVLRVCTARGRSAETAVHRLHCYPQWNKIGSVRRFDNFPRGYEFVCKSSWTLAAWQMRKLSTVEARRELVFNRDQVESSLQKLSDATTAELESYWLSEKRKVQKLLEAPGSLGEFKTIPPVEDWRLQYDRKFYGVLTRFKFLVLFGDSRWGKTRFACNLWGCARTFVANCQGVTQPSLLGYDPRIHSCIVLDEPGPDLVNSIKVFLQAAVEGTEMFQSPTQRFVRWVWVYQVPIIISTNNWISWTDNSSLAKWIRENQVLVEVSDYLFHKPGPAEPPVPRRPRRPIWDPEPA